MWRGQAPVQVPGRMVVVVVGGRRVVVVVKIVVDVVAVVDVVRVVGGGLMVVLVVGVGGRVLVVVEFGGGVGGQRGVQNSFGRQRCVGEQARSVHRRVIVSKHMAVGGGHCARQSSFGGHGVLGEQD